jgi:RHS repeat-associated protein
VYDAADELTGSSGPGGSVVYGYDGRGEQTSAGAVGYGYDLAGRLTSATVAGTTTVYGYDGDGNRLSATAGASTVEYLWDTNNDLPELALERSGAGAPLRSYVRGLDTVALLEGGAWFYYHHDRLGSVTALTSATGASEWLYGYEPFGSPRTTSRPDPAAPVNPLGFTGQYQDPGSGLLNLRARQYDEASGRFLSTDPLPAGPTEPYTDPYDYADQDPVNEYDPGGECPVCVVALALGVVVVASAVYGAYESWQHAHSAPRTAPAGDAAVIVRERGVIVEIYSNDHGPPHAHVVGGGPETRIGQNGKPIDDDPELTQRQRQVVEGHRGAIRKRIGRAMRDYRHH